MAIYEKYIGRSRESFSSLADAQRNFHISCPDDFNFAYDVIDVLSKEKPDKRALVWVSKDLKNEKIFTFADMARESDRAANFFYRLGIRKGDRVLLVLKRHYSFWYLILGLHKIGAVEVHATAMLTAKDYVYRCNAAKVKCVILTGDDGCTEHFDGGEGKYETLEHKFVIGGSAPEGWRDFDAEFAKTPAEWDRSLTEKTQADDLMMMCFSSGTTGYPKIITHNFRYPLGHIMTGVFWHRCIDGGLHFTVSDTGWMKAFWGKLYGVWLAESAIMVFDFDRFNAEEILSVIEKYKVTTFCVPPTMYRMILQHEVEKYDLSSVTHCCTAGEALGPEIYNEWLTRTGHKIYEGFGQSETPVIVASIAPWTEPTPGSMGLSAPGFDVHIIDEDGNDTPIGATGEICIKMPVDGTHPCGLMTSYNFNEEETANAYRGGFYHTGDTAYRDERGMFRYVGRNDDIIKSSGYRIGPFEIESVMLEHPAVLEVAVTAVPEAVRGFLVKATVVLKNGYVGSDELVKELQRYVKVNTAPYKYPRIIEFVDALPKTFSGKIRRTEIRKNDEIKYAYLMQKNN